MFWLIWSRSDSLDVSRGFGCEAGGISHPPVRQRVVHDEEHRCPDDCHHHAIHIQSGDAWHAERVEQPATHHRPDYAQKNIQQHPFTRFVHELARDESRN